MSRRNIAMAGVAALYLGGVTGTASAAVTGPFSSNECGAGGFSNCTLTINETVTPAIIKFDSNFEVADISLAFPSVTGAEFSFFDILTDDGEVEGASFSYTLGSGDPGITGFAVSAAGGYLLYDLSSFSFANGVYTGSFSTDGLGNNENNPSPELSHITFFDTAPGGGGGGVTPIPLPASALLLLAGLGGLTLLRRRT